MTRSRINNPEYSWYVCLSGPESVAILSGWEYESDAKDDLKEKKHELSMFRGIELRVLAGRTLRRVGCDPDDNDNWVWGNKLNALATKISANRRGVPVHTPKPVVMGAAPIVVTLDASTARDTQDILLLGESMGAVAVDIDKSKHTVTANYYFNSADDARKMRSLVKQVAESGWPGTPRLFPNPRSRRA